MNASRYAYLPPETVGPVCTTKTKLTIQDSATLD